MQEKINITWSGIWEQPKIGNLDYSIIDNQVFLDIDMTIGESTKSATIISDFLPKELRPLSNKFFSILTMDNNIQSITPMQIQIDGRIIIYGNNNFANFLGVNFSGFYNIGARYSLL